MNSWTEEYKNSVFDSLNRGEAILNTQDQLDCYLHSYSQMHYAKLQKAFDGYEEWLSRMREYKHLVRGGHTEIIDYGSGLGLGTIALIEYLYGSLLKANCRITLIDPSYPALERAELYLSEAGALKGPGCIRLVNKTIDGLEGHFTDSDFMPAVQKFHLFSNVLDIESIDLETLAEEIFRTQEGSNYFICIVPNHPSKSKRLDEFVESLKVCLSGMEYCNIEHDYEVVFESNAKVGKWYSYIKVVRINMYAEDFGEEEKDYYEEEKEEDDFDEPSWEDGAPDSGGFDWDNPLDGLNY